jgi:YbbR domain-containing protein
MKKITPLVLFALLLYINPTFSQSQVGNLAGDWILTTHTNSSVQKQYVSIYERNGKYVATTKDFEFNVIVEGDEIKWKIEKSSNSGSLTIVANGERAPDGNYNGTTSAKSRLLELQRMKWSLDRVK